MPTPPTNKELINEARTHVQCLNSLMHDLHDRGLTVELDVQEAFLFGHRTGRPRAALTVMQVL